MKVARLIFGIFFAIGLGLLTGSYFAFQHTRRFLATAAPAQGVVLENVYRSSGSSSRHGSSWSYYPHVRFRTGEGRDIDFVSTIGSSPPSYSANQTVSVLYDPQRPYQASIDSFGSLWATSLGLSIMGIVFIGPGIGLVIWQRASNRKNAWLEANGRRIVAEFTRVELNTSLQVNGKSPYRIVCQWLDPLRNEMHVFRSPNLWFDPSEFVHEKTLIVMMDPDKPHRYLVDTSFLPKVV